MCIKTKFVFIGLFLVLHLGRAYAVIRGNDQKCLATTMYREARGESLTGKMAVGEVILNRLQAGFGRTVCSVVGSDEFSHSSVHLSKEELHSFLELAKNMLHHENIPILPKHVLYFNNRPFKNRKYKLFRKIGHQRFYTLPKK
jgi:hypothetical protein